jgi:hypothetical protein
LGFLWNAWSFSRFKNNKVVKMQQFQWVGAYKKKHSSHRGKFFHMQIMHDFDELHSVMALLAPPLL